MLRRLLPVLFCFLALNCDRGEVPAAAANSASGNGERPNILLFLADDWSFPHAGVYGDRTVQTPNFDALAAGGMLLTNAYCASPSCSPSRASILTGRYPHQNGAAGNLWSEFPAELLVYPELLEAAGYATGYEQKGWGPGDWKATGRPKNPTGETHDSMHEFLDTKDPEKPFCYWFGSFDPHREYEPNLGVLTGMHLDSVELPPMFPDLPCVRNDVLDYYAEVERFDRHVGHVVKLLRARGELENTLIIVTSDNGMPFPRAKATLYDYGTRMPFVAHWPARIPAGTTYDGFVNLASLAPTFLRAAGVEVPEEMTLPAIEPLLGGSLTERAEAVVLERERHAQVRAGGASYAMRGLRTDSFLYIRNYYPERWPAGDPVAVQSVGAYGDVDNSITKMLMLKRVRPPGDTTDYFNLAFGKRGAEELYAVARDPGQLRNLAADPGYASTVADMAERLTAALREAGDPRVIDPQTPFWDQARYVSTNRGDFDVDRYINEYTMREAIGSTRFADRSCLPE